MAGEPDNLFENGTSSDIPVPEPSPPSDGPPVQLAYSRQSHDPSDPASVVSPHPFRAMLEAKFATGFIAPQLLTRLEWPTDSLDVDFNIPGNPAVCSDLLCMAVSGFLNEWQSAPVQSHRSPRCGTRVCSGCRTQLRQLDLVCVFVVFWFADLCCSIIYVVLWQAA